MQGHFAFQTLYAGYKLGVFTYLAAHPGATRDTLAEALYLADRPATFLVCALRTLGLVTGPDTALHNAPVVNDHFSDSSPDNYGPILDFYQHLIYPLAADLTDSLQRNANTALHRLGGEGSTLYERMAARPDLEKTFHLGMSAVSRIGAAGLVGSGLFSRHERLLDVGGGDATNSIALLRAHPHLTSILLDLPSVLDLARSKIVDSGLDGRIELCPADMLSDPFPGGADAVLFAHIMPIFGAEENQFLLAQAHQVLPSGGSVVIYNAMRNDSEDGPIYAALFSAHFLAIVSGQGIIHRWKDYEAWLSRAGFRDVGRTDSLPFHNGLIWATKT